MSNMNKLQLTKIWYKYAEDLLLNKKIVKVHWSDWDEEEWTQTGLVFVTEDNTAFFLSSDDEGNNPGALHWSSDEKITENKTTHGIIPVGVMDKNAYYKALIDESIQKEKKGKGESKKSKS